MSELSKKTIKELKIYCKENNIKGISKKNKKQLLEMISSTINKEDDITNSMANLNLNLNIETKTDDNKSDVKVKNTSTDENILSVKYWKKTKAFKSIKDKETQIKYYKRMNSCEEVLQLVDLESKPFGTESEKIIQEIFNLGPRTSTQNDGTRHNKKIEIKSARYWAGKDDCVWQHLEPEHDYEFAIFALLDFQAWKVWGIKKSLLMGEMREKKIVTFQGKQGWWVKKSAIVSYLTSIKNISELDAFIQS